jgi:hypothetical protein
MARGHTLIEVIIVAALVGAIALVTTGASDSINTAARYGGRKLDVDAEAQEILHFIANDLQNSSTDTDPVTLIPRYELTQDQAVVELVDRTAGNLATGDVTDTKVITAAEDLEGRPRNLTIPYNSRFRVQKVSGINVDPVIGEVETIWSSPIQYSVLDRQLVRDQDGRRQVIGTGVTAFRVVAEAQGNFRVFLRIQRRSPTTGEVLTASGMIEINPKNR